MKRFIGTKEVQEVAECGPNHAREIIREVNAKLQSNGIRIVHQYKAPLKEVLKHIGQEDDLPLYKEERYELRQMRN